MNQIASNFNISDDEAAGMRRAYLRSELREMKHELNRLDILLIKSPNDFWILEEEYLKLRNKINLYEYQLKNRILEKKVFDIPRIKDIPMERVLRYCGLEPIRGKYLCPFHDDKHASLSIFKSKNTFKCFACGEGGDNIDFVMKFMKIKFNDACEYLLKIC